jgi:hypothetical protein
MKPGGKFLTATAIVALTACSFDEGKLEIRSTPSTLAQGARPVPQRIAEARGKLAIGNVALALEAFRIAWREDPNSVDALAGMAACYDLMGRYDLSRRNYEAALAIAPADTGLLGAFAQSLQQQGELAEAQSVRNEIAHRLAATKAAETPQLALRDVMPAPTPEIATLEFQSPQLEARLPMTLAASAPVTVTEEQASEVEIPRPELAAASVQVAANTAAPPRTDVSVPDVPDAKVVADEPAPEPAVVLQNVEQAALGPSVTVKLPAARKVEAVAPAMPTAQATAAPPVIAASTDLPPLKPYTRPVPKPAVVEEQGPRLERLSMGEIGLVTAPGPMWRATTVAKTQQSTTVRWVSLRDASTRPSLVRVLNAARVNRLAARTRSWLVAHGWSSMAIGDAPAARSRSVVVYPSSQRALAQTLANQFGFAMEESPDAKFVTMLLGRDAARLEELRLRRA